MVAEVDIGDFLGHCRGEHCADVDGHIEEAEGGVTLRGIFRVVIEIADEDLEIAFEESCAYGYEGKSAEHYQLSGESGSGRDCKTEVAEKHYGNTDGDTFAVTDFVGEDSSEERHEIHTRKEDGIYLTGSALVPSELGLHQQGEDGEHGVVAEALTGVGEGQGE